MIMDKGSSCGGVIRVLVADLSVQDQERNRGLENRDEGARIRN